jgi:uncharacterized membrane protein YdjX (TVP38/TMEM64 family)
MKKGVINFFRKNWLILLILVISIAWFFYSYFTQGIIYSTINSDVDSVKATIESFGFWSYFVFILLVILEVVLAFIPPLALYAVAGTLFGGFLGGILTLIGNMLGALICFKIARRYGKKVIEKKTDKKLQTKFNNFFEKYGGVAIFILRVNPLTTSDLVSYLSGLTKIKTIKFLIATGLGLIPMIFVQTYFGDFIKNSPVLLGLTLFFSFLYIIFFLYLIIIALSRKEDKNKDQ